jgi:hypothetical protein
MNYFALKWRAVGLLVAMSIELMSCSGGEVCRTPVMTVKSPSGIIATVCDNTQQSLGATVATATVLHLSEPDQALSEKTRILSADGLKEVQMEWVSNDRLRFRYQAGKIYSFRNFWYPVRVDTKTRAIRIILDDTTASAK